MLVLRPGAILTGRFLTMDSISLKVIRLLGFPFFLASVYRLYFPKNLYIFISQMYRPKYICNIFYFFKLYLIGAMYHFYLNCLFVISFLLLNLMRNLTILLVFQRPHVGFTSLLNFYLLLQRFLLSLLYSSS